jgi:hypothetical protein
MKHSNKILAIGTLGIGAIAYLARNRIIDALPATGYLPGEGMNRNDVRLALRAKAIEYGYPAEWFDAIAKVETLWRLDQVNNTGGDALYGGSYGPMQMTYKTAQSLGYHAPDFLTNPGLAGDAAGEYLQSGQILSFPDAIAWWNGGKKTFAALDQSKSTYKDYWPKAQKALEYVTNNPPEGAEIA